MANDSTRLGLIAGLPLLLLSASRPINVDVFFGETVSLHDDFFSLQIRSLRQLTADGNKALCFGYAEAAKAKANEAKAIMAAPGSFKWLPNTSLARGELSMTVDDLESAAVEALRIGSLPASTRTSCEPWTGEGVCGTYYALVAKDLRHEYGRPNVDAPPAFQFTSVYVPPEWN